MIFDIKEHVKDFDKDELIKELLANPRINKRVKELDLSPEQIEDAIPIMMDMDKQDPENEIYLITFYKTPTGAIQRSEALSERGKKLSFRKNIATLNIYPVDFDDSKEFIKDEERKTLVNEFAKYIKGEKQTQGLYIYGPMGVGKSFTAKRFAKKLAEQGNKVGIVSLPELVSTVKSTFGTNEKYDALSNVLKTVDYLFIDDIGAEAITAWFRDEFLFSILNARMNKELTTFFTSNYNFEDLAKQESKTTNQKYKDFDKAQRLLSRIKTLSKPIALDGKNRRY